MNKHFLLVAMLFIAFTGFAQNPCGKAYVRSNQGPPWGQNTNEQAMDIAFGAGQWDQAFFQTVNVATLFSPAYGVVVLEGGDFNANALEAFLQANLPAIEAWVFAGNALMINAAPNQGNGMSYGFGGVSLTYPSFVPNANSPNPGHPIFQGPALPVVSSYTGNFYGHGIICPPSLPASVLMANQVNPNAHVAVEATWGAGYVIFGGMTTTNWHQPNPQAMNLRANMFSYLEANGCGAAPPPGGANCYDNTCVVVTCPADVTVQCIEDFTPDAANATAVLSCGAEIGRWVTQPHQTGGPNCDGTTYVFTYKVADDQGNIGCCDQTVTIVNDPPMISVIPGGTVSCFDDIVVSPGDATVTTSCGEELDITIYAPVINGEPQCPGTTYTYTYRVEDQCEREATADRVFTIGAGQNPVVTAPDNVTCECLAGVNAYPHNASVQTSCGVDATVAVTGPVISGPIDCPGTTYTYTYTGTDACNRTGSDAQTFTVSNGPPVLDGPENCLILNCEDEGWQDIIQAWLASVTATTSCGQPLTVFNNYNPNAQGVCISNGTTNVTWRATDQCGRQSTLSSMIIINDTEPPVFVEEAQDELDICNYNTPHEFDAWVDAHGNSLALDGCDQNITSNQWSTIPNNPSINCNGAMGPTSVTVTFVVRDDCGNKSSSTATFTALMAGGDIVEDGDGPAEATTVFGLNQNQPNPFSNETVISFTLPTDASATLTIYDLSGKVVKLVQGEFSQGYNEIQLSRSELSGAGMLYYELSTATDTAVKKMIIVD